jgi:hypothetical protein
MVPSASPAPHVPRAFERLERSFDVERTDVEARRDEGVLCVIDLLRNGSQLRGELAQAVEIGVQLVGH